MLLSLNREKLSSQCFMQTLALPNEHPIVCRFFIYLARSISVSLNLLLETLLDDTLEIILLNLYRQYYFHLAGSLFRSSSSNMLKKQLATNISMYAMKDPIHHCHQLCVFSQERFQIVRPCIRVDMCIGCNRRVPVFNM